MMNNAATKPLKMTYRKTVRAVLREALTDDEKVFLMGEDVGALWRHLRLQSRFLAEFGEERIRETRPIVEVATVNLSLLALDQVVNRAANLRYMSGGQFSVPLVVQMATAGDRQLAAQHSHSLENWHTHIPEIKVLACRNLSKRFPICRV